MQKNPGKNSEFRGTPYKWLHALPLLNLILAGICMRWGDYGYGVGALLILVIPTIGDLILPESKFEPSLQPDTSLFRVFIVTTGLAVLGFLFHALAVAPAEINAYWVLAAVSTGAIFSASGLTAAHEFIHSKSRSIRTLGLLLLACAGYTHYRITHLRTHHPFVGTDADPASAREGQTLYHYLFSNLIGGYFRAWHMEIGRLKTRGLSIFAWQNQMVQYSTLQVLIGLIIFWFWSWNGVGFWIVQSIIATSLQASVDYIQHYGLRRPKRSLTASQFTLLGSSLSWETSGFFSNIGLWNVALHNDHHFAPEKTYDSLVRHRLAPKLPHGVSLMVTLAFVSPIFFKIMGDKKREFAMSSHPNWSAGKH